MNRKMERCSLLSSANLKLMTKRCSELFKGHFFKAKTFPNKEEFLSVMLFIPILLLWEATWGHESNSKSLLPSCLKIKATYHLFPDNMLLKNSEEGRLSKIESCFSDQPICLSGLELPGNRYVYHGFHGREIGSGFSTSYQLGKRCYVSCNRMVVFSIIQLVS